MGGHDPRRDLAGAGVFGLTGAAGFGGVIGADAPIAARERVVAVGAQRHPIGAGSPGPPGLVICLAANPLAARRAARCRCRADGPYWSGLVLRRDRSKAR